MVRRRPGQLFPVEVQILDAGMELQSTEGTFYGFAIARRLAEVSGDGLLAHGTLYKALGRLSDAGLIEAEWEDASLAVEDGRPRRRLYRVTGEGATVLARERARLQVEVGMSVHRPAAGLA